jgi:branched-chain amino acid transport system ATP-binding protein
VITVDHLSVNYGAIEALRDVSFTVETGKVTAVLGANGAGKTTLLRTISGLLRPANGTVRLVDTVLTGRHVEEIARLGVGHVPEGRGVIAEFTVEENLRLGGLAAKVDLAAGLEDAYQLFPVLGERRKQHASTLSGGERQMLAMARALIAQPKVLLLDEPSLGLAPLVTQEMMQSISHLCATRQLTVVLVEQNAKSALKIADRAVVFHIGNLVASGTAEEIAQDDQLRRYYLGLVS